MHHAAPPTPTDLVADDRRRVVADHKAFRGQVPVGACPLAGQLHALRLSVVHNLGQPKVLQTEAAEVQAVQGRVCGAVNTSGCSAAEGCCCCRRQQPPVGQPLPAAVPLGAASRCGAHRYLALPVAIKKDVCWLEVVVNNGAWLCVQVDQACQYLSHHGLGLLLWQRLQAGRQQEQGAGGEASGRGVRRREALGRGVRRACR